MRHLVLLALVSCAPRPGQLFVPVGAGDAGETSSATDGGRPCTPICTAWTNPRPVGLVLSPVVELSGLVASRRQSGVLFAHNDSGDSARFWALSATNAAILQEFTVQGATNRDWEDLGYGPCGDAGTCLFLGDIGDNNRVRTDYAVYVVPEPQVTSGGAMMSVPGERLPFQYPNAERHNAESLIVDPSSGRPYVLTKEPGGQASLVFRFPLPLTPGTQVTLEPVATLPVPTPTDLQLTGADVSPCGDALLLRMYNRLVMLTADGGLESAFTAAPQSVPVAQEGQGEAVAFSADGRSYFTASETLTAAPDLFQSTCR
jgi:hypothetical protein